jgi:hypothetical protein
MSAWKMIKLFKKIKHIILGWYYNFKGINYELLKTRMEICNKCEYKIRLTKNVEICDKCGCILSAKTRVKDEYCLLKKW